MAANLAQNSTSANSVNKISAADSRKFKGALSLVLMSLSMPMLVLMNVRYILADSYVSPSANQVIGGIAAVLMLISAFTVGSGGKAYRAGNARKAQTSLFWTFGLGLAAFVLFGVQIVNHTINIVTHYGETFVTTLGALDIYLLIGLVAILGLRSRMIRRWGTDDHSWGVQSNVILWRFLVIVTLVMYVQLYLL